MTRDEMLEQLELLTKDTELADDAARDYERTGRRDALERIQVHCERASKSAKELEDWHR